MKWSKVGQNKTGILKELQYFGLANAWSVRQQIEKDNTMYQIIVDPLNHIECLYSMFRPMGKTSE